jgi:hypothetical protein
MALLASPSGYFSGTEMQVSLEHVTDTNHIVLVYPIRIIS